MIGNKEITSLRTAYSQGMHNEIFAIIGSMGFLEIATNRGSAGRLLSADRGTEVGFVVAGGQAAAAPAAPAPAQ